MSGPLYTESEGRGTELVLLHGWGLHSGIWDSLIPRLASHLRLTRIDLPGHGRSRHVPMPDSLGELSRRVMDATPPHAVLLGWSLGGLVALRAALDTPARLRGLVLANTTPRFVAAPDWPEGMPPEQLQEFADGLTGDYRETLRRFLSLQVRSDEAARAVLRRLREVLFAHGEPDTASLGKGLELLRGSDLRTELGAIHLPTLVLAGGRDRLTPPGAGEYLARAIPGARLQVFPKSAHAPFVSHVDEFVPVLLEFMRRFDARHVA